jgi:hypothetical protein
MVSRKSPAPGDGRGQRGHEPFEARQLADQLAAEIVARDRQLILEEVEAEMSKMLPPKNVIHGPAHDALSDPGALICDPFGGVVHDGLRLAAAAALREKYCCNINLFSLFSLRTPRSAPAPPPHALAGLVGVPEVQYRSPRTSMTPASAIVFQSADQLESQKARSTMPRPYACSRTKLIKRCGRPSLRLYFEQRPLTGGAIWGPRALGRTPLRRGLTRMAYK